MWTVGSRFGVHLADELGGMQIITVVSPSSEFTERLSLVLLGQSNLAVTSWWDELIAAQPEYAVDKIQESRPSLVLLGPELERNTVLDLAAELHHRMPEVSVIEIAEPDPSLFPQAMSVGIRDIVAEDSPFEVLRDRINRALAVSERLTARRQTNEDVERGSMVVVVAPKGGTGKTSTIVNLAIVLSQQHPGEVVLIDLDLQFGGVCETLMVDPLYTICDAARLQGPLDSTSVKALLTPRDGMFILAAPESPEGADAIDSALVETVISALSTEFKWILVDTAAGIEEETIWVIENATDTLLLVSEDMLSLTSMRKTIGLLDQLGFTNSARTLVLNRANSKVGLDREAVEQALGARIDIEIPSTRQVPISLNRGEPYTEANPNSTISRRIADIALRLVDSRDRRRSSLVGGTSASR